MTAKSTSQVTEKLLEALFDCITQCDPFELLVTFNLVAEEISEALGTTPETMLEAHKNLMK